MDPHDFVDELGSGRRLVRSKDEFNKAAVHIVGLLSDAHVLWSMDRCASSVLFSITATEETAKAHLGLFTEGFRQNEGSNRSVFFDHKAKHLLAALETVRMGERLGAAIGDDRVDELMRMARNGELMGMRNAALYFERRHDDLVVPTDRIDRVMARELLLFAIEVFDDALVGITNLTYTLSEKTDEFFQEVAAV